MVGLETKELAERFAAFCGCYTGQYVFVIFSCKHKSSVQCGETNFSYIMLSSLFFTVSNYFFVKMRPTVINSDIITSIEVIMINSNKNY